LPAFLKGKNAVVTGSSSGIGLGIARVLAQHGANIMLHGLADHKQIDTLKHQFVNDFPGIKVHFNSANMRVPEQAQQLINDAAKVFDQDVSILVNNAGIQHVCTVEKFPAEQWEDIIAVNLSSLFYTTRTVLPLMKRQNFGRIINISSVHGLVASAAKSAYVAAKHGVMGLTKVVALETAGTGITCNAINPGWVLTPLVEAQIRARAAAANISFEQAKADLVREKQPSQQMATPEQLGAVAAFLCSDAASQMTGIAVPVDGGWTAQ